MSSLQISSLLSGDLSEYIRRNLAVAHGLASAFQRLPPALDQLRTTLVDPNGDVTVHQQYRSLCRNLREVGSEALAFMDLLESVLSLRGDRERWARIDGELLTASAETDLSGGDVQSYPHLLGFEEEMRIRMEGLGRVRDKLCSSAQQVEVDRRALFVQSGYSSVDLMLRGVQTAKHAAIGIFALGTVIFLLGVSGISSQMAYFSHPLCLMFLVCLGLVYQFLYSKQSSLERDKMRGNEAISAANDVTSEICSHSVTLIWEATQKGAPLPQVRLSAEKFFKAKGEEDQENLQKSKSELRRVINSI
jgi:hypothetical protein